MIHKPRTDVYLDRGNGDLARIASFKEYKEYEMVLGFSGISSANPTLAHQYDDSVVTKEEMSQLRTNYADAKATNLVIDHFTVHCEKAGCSTGEFHLRVDYLQSQFIKFPSLHLLIS